MLDAYAVNSDSNDVEEESYSREASDMESDQGIHSEDEIMADSSSVVYHDQIAHFIGLVGMAET